MILRVALSLAVVTAVLTFSGCGGRGVLAPVVDQAGHPTHVPASHRVRRGETLYSIAWEYGLDYRELAARNGIRRPYRIVVGQRLALRAAPRAAVRPARKTPAHTPRATPAAPKPHPPKPPAKSRKVRVPAVRKDIASTRHHVSWGWPTSGRLTVGYSARRQGKKGITIAGRLGQPVLAAAAGRVVYAGNGLVGYGQLIIIKHSRTYLSAYGYNRRLLVHEGQVVRRGERIAAMGRNGREPPALYFELRHDGRPVNPLAYLPRR